MIADDLTPEQVKAYRIADNKIAEHSTWENDLLAKELQELNLLDLDLSVMGFEDWELMNLLEPITEGELQNMFEDKPQKEKKVKLIKCPQCGCEFEQ